MRAYKRLSAVERAFRSLKTVDLRCGPCSTEPPTGCARMCSCACWPITWNGICASGSSRCCSTTTTGPPRGGAHFHRGAGRGFSEAAKEKARGKRTANGLPVHSFRTLLGDLATITRNRVVAQVSGAVPFEVLTRPTALQREAFKLLGVRP